MVISAKELVGNSYLNEREIMYYRNRKAEITNYLMSIRNSPYRPVRNVDPAQYLTELRSIDKILAQRTPPVARGVQKDRLWKRAKELESIIGRDMPTKDQVWGKRVKNDDGSYRREADDEAVQQHIAWEKKNKSNINEYISIMKILEPKQMCSWVEKLRRPH